ncbi:MAG: dihydropteroate synthase [Campylobacterales bacterium]|nr:dihydropteroate synthase [Campylobacterales bacterium]
MITKLSAECDFEKLLSQIGVDNTGIKILAKKSEMLHFFIKNLNIKAANILKQDALSVGADLAVSKGVAAMSVEATDAVLFCTPSQLEKLIKKESIQPFGLKALSSELAAFAKAKSQMHPQIMGILNINEDSFFKSSRTSSSEFEDRFLQMAEYGADIIDIGAVSSRPGSIYPGEDEELRRLEGVFETITKASLAKKVRLSLDTFSPRVAQAALECGFGIINDITGLRDDALADVCGKYNAEVVIMHMDKDPQNMQKEPHYDDLFCSLDSFFEERIKKAQSFGIKNILLDVGIGFGKTLEHNLSLIKNLSNFGKHGFALLVGASRKSMIDAISRSAVEDRLGGTLSIHQKALDNGASIIRCHDVKEHVQMLRVWQALKDITI